MNIIKYIKSFFKKEEFIPIPKKGEKIVNAKQIKAIIGPIPSEKFCIDRYTYYNGKCCFLGHIHKALSNNAYGDTDGYGARQLTARFLLEKHKIYADGAQVNNSPTINGYTEPEIKDRLMHLINDMIKAGY